MKVYGGPFVFAQFAEGINLHPPGGDLERATELLKIGNTISRQSRRVLRDLRFDQARVATMTEF